MSLMWPKPRVNRCQNRLMCVNTSTRMTMRLRCIWSSRYLMDAGVRLSSEEMYGEKRGYWHPERRLIAVRRTDIAGCGWSHPHAGT